MKQVGRDLNVRYILEGSVRKSGNRVRITGQLIDTATGAHFWADRFDGAMPAAQKAMVRLREIDPTRRVSTVKDWLPLRRPDDLTRLQEGLRRAGLPE